MQAFEAQTGPIATAADNAYNAGAIVIAANGNCALNDDCTSGPGTPRPKTVRSPALAHKVLGAGAYDVLSNNTPGYQSLGPAPDGRIKPDLQTPTNTETASNASDTALHAFGGTSGSTPYLGAAAALVQDWLLTTAGFVDNGQIYAWLLVSGQRAFPTIDNTRGAGPVKLLLGGSVSYSKRKIAHGQTLQVPFTTNEGDRLIDAAIWWPESAAQQHNNINLRVIDPSNVERGSSTSIPSVFERVRVRQPLPVGTWTLRIEGVSVPAGPQVVYYVISSTP
jgi:hypothetical protein